MLTLINANIDIYFIEIEYRAIFITSLLSQALTIAEISVFEEKTDFRINTS